MRIRKIKYNGLVKLDYRYILLAFICGGLITACSSHSTVDWHKKPGYRWAKVYPRHGKTGFKELKSSNTGINFNNHLPDSLLLKNRFLLNGSGVAVGDINGNGRPDIYFCQIDGPNKLYENTGDMYFEEITDSAGIGLAQKGYYSTGAVFADVDGDDNLDLLVTSLNKTNNLYLNDGNGYFHLAKNYGLEKSHGATTMALSDINGDGYLDLYITNYRKKSVRDVFDPKKLSWKNTTVKTGDTYRLKPKFRPYYMILHPKDQQPNRRKAGEVDELYLNNGKGHFKKETDLKHRFLKQNGQPMGLKRDWGLAAEFHDINGDGLPDLYVSNDYWSPDRIWINQGNGTFKEINEKSIQNSSFASMAVGFGDINADGYTDFFTTEMVSSNHKQRLSQSGSEYSASLDLIFPKRPQYNRNSLYLNRGDATFAQIADYAGVQASGWSWAPRFMDINLDGYPDLLINNGYLLNLLDMDTQIRTKQQILKGTYQKKDYVLEYPPLRLVNKAYKNNGDLTFTNKSTDWGFHDADVSQGMATADFDNDGDMDIVINRMNEKASVYENTTSHPRIAVRLEGEPPNTQAIGARIKVRGGEVPQTKELTSGGGYESGSVPQAMFAANGSGFYSIVVRWAGGGQTKIDSVKNNRIYEINEAKSVKIHPDTTRNVKNNERSSWFRDVSDRITYRHYEDSFPDFQIQSLLPKKLSKEGPGIAWIDYNDDGNEDLWIASGKGGRTGVFKNMGDGQFKHVSLPKVNHLAQGDQTSIIGWHTKKTTFIAVGSANFEQETAQAPSAYIYEVNSSRQINKQSIPGSPSTTGSLAAADYDGDGDIDLFIGGQFMPWFYPRNATSRLFKNKNDNFELDKKNTDAFKNIGLVTSTAFCDIDADGDPDLILATEWGAIKIFRNDNGTFHDVTEKWGMDDYDGWWRGIAVGDFNNSGRMDLVATNMGRNNSYNSELDKQHPMRMYYADFNNDRHLDIIESYYDSSLEGYVPRRRAFAFKSVSSSVLQNVKSNRQFSHSTLHELLGHNLNLTPYKKINTLQSMIFMNDGSHFEAHPLPAKAQLSAASYAGVADVNNDGNEDIFLSQNLFALPSHTPRMDAGRGLWLKGDGKGHFKAISGSKSGIKIYGDQRGAALGDFNKDGRIDLAVSQNGGPLKLYLNKIKKRGYRIHLKGPDANKDGIGSSIRLVYKDGSGGPRREIEAGSGYWSQNSAVQVMGAAKRVAKIEVDWYDGTRQSVHVSSSMMNYTISYKR